jgi:uncharacterized protein (DUF924 family)
MTDDRIAELLHFWFATAGRERWFAVDPAFDREVAARFGDLPAEATAGQLDHWRAEARGALALCLVLDQLPRNLWRGTARAFATDAQARQVARGALAAGFDRGFRPEERLFFYLPFEHSEALADQDRSVELVGSLGDSEWLDHARRHRAVIRRFGRFPHRNKALGRASTPAELAYLQESGSSF